MENTLRIKPANWIVQIVIPIIVLSVMAIILWGIGGEVTFIYVFAYVMCLAAVLHFIFLMNTRNRIFLIPMGFYLFAALTFFMSSAYHQHYLTAVFAILAGTFFILLLYALATHKMKWRYREVLELAARSVNETKNGYTPRQFPAGQAEYSKDEIIGFARFLLKNSAAFPFYEKDKVILIIPGNMLYYFLGLRRNYLKDSYISFDFAGNVAVNITRKDYRKYTEELTFDQLCASFGNLFKEFLEMYKNGEGNKIIKKMNALKLVV